MCIINITVFLCRLTIQFIALLDGFWSFFYTPLYHHLTTDKHVVFVIPGMSHSNVILPPCFPVCMRFPPSPRPLSPTTCVHSEPRPTRRTASMTSLCRPATAPSPPTSTSSPCAPTSSGSFYSARTARATAATAGMTGAWTRRRRCAAVRTRPAATCWSWRRFRRSCWSRHCSSSTQTRATC